jgi:hypothetical protein
MIDLTSFKAAKPLGSVVTKLGFTGITETGAQTLQEGEHREGMIVVFSSKSKNAGQIWPLFVRYSQERICRCER